MREKIIQNMKEKKIITIIRGLEPAICLKLAEALYEGGINMIEVTFEQTSQNGWRDTREAISSMAAAFSGKVFVGAGTVLTKEQVRLAKAAGAGYMIAPSVNPEVISYAKEQGLVSIPGAMTPTEVVTAYEAGADFVKLFPAGTLGPDYMKAIKAPLSHIPLLAVGGITEGNLEAFLKAGAAGAGIGGSLANREWIAANRFDKVTELAKRYTEIAARA